MFVHRFFQHAAILSALLALAACGTPPLAEPQDRTVCLVSHDSRAERAHGPLARQNHRLYAARHGYQALFYPGPISAAHLDDPTQPVQAIPFGDGLDPQKIAAMRLALDGQAPQGFSGTLRPCSWAVWLDADAVIANLARPIEPVIEAAGGSLDDAPLVPASVHAIFADAFDPLRINAGALMIKNSPAGKAVLQSLADAPRGLTGAAQPSR